VLRRLYTLVSEPPGSLQSARRRGERSFSVSSRSVVHVWALAGLWAGIRRGLATRGQCRRVRLSSKKCRWRPAAGAIKRRKREAHRQWLPSDVTCALWTPLAARGQDLKNQTESSHVPLRSPGEGVLPSQRGCASAVQAAASASVGSSNSTAWHRAIRGRGGAAARSPGGHAARASLVAPRGPRVWSERARRRARARRDTKWGHRSRSTAPRRATPS